MPRTAIAGSRFIKMAFAIRQHRADVWLSPRTEDRFSSILDIRMHSATSNTPPFIAASLLLPDILTTRQHDHDCFAEEGDACVSEPIAMSHGTSSSSKSCGDVIGLLLITGEASEHALTDEDFRLECEAATWLLFDRIVLSRQRSRSSRTSCSDGCLNESISHSEVDEINTRLHPQVNQRRGHSLPGNLQSATITSAMQQCASPSPNAVDAFSHHSGAHGRVDSLTYILHANPR